MSRFLTREGFAVRTASEGRGRIAPGAELMPAAITLDVMMPGMDGWTVLCRSRQTGMRDIPVIMLTMVDDPERGFALGPPISLLNLRIVSVWPRF